MGTSAYGHDGREPPATSGFAFGLAWERRASRAFFSGLINVAVACERGVARCVGPVTSKFAAESHCSTNQASEIRRGTLGLDFANARRAAGDRGRAFAHLSGGLEDASRRASCNACQAEASSA